MRYIELFSGIGGFKKASELLSRDSGIPFDCVAFSEIDAHALKTYKANYNITEETEMNDIISFADKDENVNSLVDFDILMGGFPCQAFSLMGKQLGFSDDRGSILFSIKKILNVKTPEFIVLENVRHLEKHNNGDTLHNIMNFFRKNGYHFVETVVLNTREFGLPQRRSRIFIVCSRRELEIELTQERIIDNFRNIDEHSLCIYNNVLDILDKNVDNKYYLSEKIKHTILADGSKNFKSKSQIDLDIARTLTATMVKMHRACQDNYYSDDYIINGISHKDTAKEILYTQPVRKLTPKEALMLQGFDEEFFNNAKDAEVSDHQLYKQAGNGLSVNTMYALLHYLFVNQRIQD
ncbi:DNA (cytosine-5)-methyltransferase 1 [Dysgonomonas alginatilytica]|uniref:Cytosine-specific methyltransferase n=1 Tax=Dysgonomonas alginatilytica TaxID=1605892 RepID=A0A2V3PUD0_9BACT|nr:DNA (cytosine-5-)-methyltransferase [Dysgonomonas alginatilytica]PXV66925.1 DNA (cytosine-5)-methyltransferase 1 [Dysgonomonas alginatilytica]